MTKLPVTFIHNIPKVQKLHYCSLILIIQLDDFPGCLFLVGSICTVRFANVVSHEVAQVTNCFCSRPTMDPAAIVFRRHFLL